MRTNKLVSRLAGSDTIAIAVRAIFYYLAKTPEVYKKVVGEVDEADRNGNLSHLITFEESQNLRYL